MVKDFTSMRIAKKTLGYIDKLSRKGESKDDALIRILKMPQRGRKPGTKMKRK